jgi:hypothetical protein
MESYHKNWEICSNSYTNNAFSYRNKRQSSSYTNLQKHFPGGNDISFETPGRNSKMAEMSTGKKNFP